MEIQSKELEIVGISKKKNYYVVPSYEKSLRDKMLIRDAEPLYHYYSLSNKQTVSIYMQVNV